MRLGAHISLFGIGLQDFNTILQWLNQNDQMRFSKRNAPASCAGASIAEG